ncbi:MAG: Trk system potassium transporter TrkA [Firmicutes bacterium]|nr:Trk system potassium transporter TrkA [Bacillota bacterium]
MNIVIIGCGKVGSLLAEQLSKEDHDVTIVDINQQKIETSVLENDIIGVVGNGLDLEVLKEANVETADLVISVTPNDEKNLLVGIMAKELGAKRLISRVRSPEFFVHREFFKKTFGFSMIANPELDAAKEIDRMISFPQALKVETFAKGKIELAEIKIREQSKVSGLSLMQISKQTRLPILICSVIRDGEIFIPNGDFVLSKGDHIHVIGHHADLTKFCVNLGFYEKQIHKIMIVGASNLATYLTERLLERDIEVKIIERNHQKAMNIAARYPSITVIEGDGSDESILDEEGIEQMDAFVALTGMDEENIILSLGAKQMGVKKAIAKVNRNRLHNIVDLIDVDNTVSPKNVIANQIIRYVRARNNGSDNHELRTLYKLVDGKIEAVEFNVTKLFKGLDIPLKSLKLKKDILVAGISRDGQMIIPNGNDSLQEDDHIIIISKNSIQSLNGILEEK